MDQKDYADKLFLQADVLVKRLRQMRDDLLSGYTSPARRPMRVSAQMARLQHLREMAFARMSRRLEKWDNQ